MKKVLLILVFVMGLGISSFILPSSPFFMGTYCNEDSVQLSLHRTTNSWNGNFQFYAPGSGMSSGKFEIKNGQDIILTCTRNEQVFGKIVSGGSSSASIRITGLKELRPNKCE